MLSGDQILSFFPKGTLNILRYVDLLTASGIEDVIFENGLVILYPVKCNNSGHWCCLFKKGNTIYFFDSYGYIPDDQLNFSSRLQKNKQYLLDPEDFRHLTELLYKFVSTRKGNRVDYNPYTFQGEKYPDGSYIETCGYHCIARLKLKNFDTDTYYDFMKNGKTFTSDDLVVELVKIVY